MDRRNFLQSAALAPLAAVPAFTIRDKRPRPIFPRTITPEPGDIPEIDETGQPYLRDLILEGFGVLPPNVWNILRPTMSTACLPQTFMMTFHRHPDASPKIVKRFDSMTTSLQPSLTST